MGKIIQIVKANLGILALFILFLHFFLIWHYSGPSWAKIDKLEPYAKGYVHPLFVQNFKLFAPAPVWEYHIAWKAKGDEEWKSDQKADDAEHDFWKITSAYERDLGRYNLVFWMHYDVGQMKTVPDTLTYQYMESKKSLRRNIWTFPKTYMDYHKKEQNLPDDIYYVRVVFENIKEEKSDTLFVEMDYEAMDSK